MARPDPSGGGAGPSLFSRKIDVSDLTGPREVTIEASAAERRALRERLGVLDLTSLTARITLVPWRRAGVRARGSVRAHVVQACRVTLEPLGEDINEPIDIKYNNELSNISENLVENNEIVIDLEEDEPPEPIVQGMIEVGEPIAQYLALAIDPYPRKKGARLTRTAFPATGAASAPPGASEETAKGGPFAVLEALKAEKKTGRKTGKKPSR